MNTNEASLLLSTIAIATHNCDCAVPIFVPVHSPSRQAFYGHFGAGEVTVRFDSDSSPEIPSSCLHLTGLLELFQAKTPTMHLTTMQDVTISARFSWIRSFLVDQPWWAQPYMQHKEEPSDPGWGPASSAPLVLELSTRWPEFPEGNFMENCHPVLTPNPSPNPNRTLRMCP